MAHDQHDNASRLSELGVGRSISPRRYSAGSGARVFRDLLGKGMRERASALAQRFEGVDGAIAVADELEALAGPAR
jgi:UDP:flavonoid glycosyltransferase YjiC (YdhE family)